MGVLDPVAPWPHISTVCSAVAQWARGSGYMCFTVCCASLNVTIWNLQKKSGVALFNKPTSAGFLLFYGLSFPGCMNIFAIFKNTHWKLLSCGSIITSFISAKPYIFYDFDVLLSYVIFGVLHSHWMTVPCTLHSFGETGERIKKKVFFFSFVIKDEKRFKITQ